MKSYSLASLLLLVTVVGLVFAQVVTWRQLQLARADFENLRHKYGHIRVENADATSIFRFVNDDFGRALPKGIDPNESFRIRVPNKKQYVLHLTDAKNTNGLAYPSKEALVPTETVLLDPTQSTVIVSRAIKWQGAAPRVLVSTETELLFDYAPPNWAGKATSTTESWPDIQFGQKDFNSDETIRLCWWSADSLNRGFMIWLEPYEKSQARQATEAGETTEENEAVQD